MNENDLFRVMQDIGGKYTDEAHRYAAEFATTRRRRETMKSKPKESIRISVLVSGIAVAACLVFAIGFAVLMRRMNSSPIMTTNESAETILTQNESNQPSITIVSDSQTSNSNTTHPRATTAISNAADKYTDQTETTLCETNDSSLSEADDTSVDTTETITPEDPNSVIAAFESMRVTFHFSDLNGMPVQNLKVDLSPVDDIRFDYSPHFSPSDISGRSKGMAVPGHYTVIAQDTDETTVYNEMTFDLNVSAGQTEYYFVWEHTTPQDRMASSSNSFRFVITDGGEPLANAPVVLYLGHHEVHDFWTEDPPHTVELGTTDANGVVFWSAPEPGEYTLYTYVLRDGQKTKVAKQFVVDGIFGDYQFDF